MHFLFFLRFFPNSNKFFFVVTQYQPGSSSASPSLSAFPVQGTGVAAIVTSVSLAREERRGHWFGDAEVARAGLFDPRPPQGEVAPRLAGLSA